MAIFRVSSTFGENEAHKLCVIAVFNSLILNAQGAGQEPVIELVTSSFGIHSKRWEEWMHSSLIVLLESFLLVASRDTFIRCLLARESLSPPRGLQPLLLAASRDTQ